MKKHNKDALKDALIEKLDTYKAPLAWSAIAGLSFFESISFLEAVGSVFGMLFVGTVGVALVQKSQMHLQNQSVRTIKSKVDTGEQLAKDNIKKNKVEDLGPVSPVASKLSELLKDVNKVKPEEIKQNLLTSHSHPRKRKSYNLLCGVSVENILPEGTKRSRKKPASII